MKHCYEFFNVYKAFRTFVKTQHFVVIKCFRYDLGGGGGGEYASNKFLELRIRWNNSANITPLVSYTNVPGFSPEGINGPLLSPPNTHKFYFTFYVETVRH